MMEPKTLQDANKLQKNVFFFFFFFFFFFLLVLKVRDQKHTI